MDAYSQDHRLVQIDTVLGSGHVIATSVRGREAISTCFDFDIGLASTDPGILPDDLLTTPATVSVAAGTTNELTINGIIVRFAALGREPRGIYLYRVGIVPRLWLLTRTTDCRIFQNLSVREIVDSVLNDFGVSDKEWRLIGHHDKREYCVQYRETAFDFICRLLEEEGIFFYFRHEHGKHTLVLTDQNHGMMQTPNPRVVLSANPGAPGGIWRWEDGYRFRSGNWTLGDYNFETPSTHLTSSRKTVNPIFAKLALERYDYPGLFGKVDQGDGLAKLRIEYEEALYEEIAGEGACGGFSPGAYFNLVNAEKKESEKQYAITAVEHAAEDWSLVTQNADPPAYSNRFRCAPYTVPYRPAMKTPSPRIHGTQTAVVTGPAGSEIFTDKYGRIKVQFHWDRQGKKDEKTSCWIRVAQSWAGRTFGSWFLPRIGQEVVVAFMEGDPDRPLVVGSVYNAEQMVPFALPANATQSGVRTRSSMGGTAANCNELRFEDKKGSELVTFHAEKDLVKEVEHDASHWVGHDEVTTVDNNRTETVHANETITIDKNRTETVHMNETVTVDMNRSHTVGLSETLTVGINRAETVGAAEEITVGAARSVTVGAAQVITVGADQTISVGSDQAISVGSNETTSIGKDRAASIGANDSLDVGKTLTISAGDEIVLKTGSATLTMKKNGDITIEGKQISIKGSGDVIVKGQKILQN